LASFMICHWSHAAAESGCCALLFRLHYREAWPTTCAEACCRFPTNSAYAFSVALPVHTKVHYMQSVFDSLQLFHIQFLPLTRAGGCFE
jgi:hypothetical protein